MPASELINNWLFASLSGEDQLYLRPLMERRVVQRGEVLLRAGDRVEVVHFPTSAQIANVMILNTGERLAVSIVGREGVTGLAAFMADEPIGWDAVVLIGGTVWAVPADALQALAETKPEVSAILLHATHRNQVEAHGEALCAAFHTVTGRIARWLLMLQERSGLSIFELTQQDIADLLGVQRTTVVAAFRAISAEGGLSRQRRGKIVIVDRAALKALACTCYGQCLQPGSKVTHAR